MAPQRLSAWLGLVLLALASCTSKQAPTDPATAPKGVDSTAMKTSAASVSDDPAAHALYNQMVEAMRKAKSLSYVSHCTSQAKGRTFEDCTYRACLKKPNYFRVEVEYAPKFRRTDAKPGPSGILIGDGNTAWTYWPQGRVKRSFEEAKEYEKTRLTSYMKKPAPPGGHSIGHEMCSIGPFPIIDPSTFHGYTDSLQTYLDGVKPMSAEKVGEEECDGIEVSFMKHQRSWYLWLSRKDHLPRKLHEVVRVSYDLLIDEQWSSIAVNGDIDDKMFAWRPPDGWTQWKMPPIEIGLLKPGTKAPDFELASAEGGRIKLSDYRGRIVWFYVWRAG